MDSKDNRPSNFLAEIVAQDVASNTYGGRVSTRFPPEPNGYPHIGHAKSICLNFGLAEDFGGTCILRYDDTNPATESPEYVEALEDAVRWLGFEPAEITFTSDYFEQLYQWAIALINKGLAFVDSESGDEIRTHRGTVTEAGVASRYRDRSVEENLRLFDEMRRGEHEDGSHVLRAKIDMANPNMKLRDPILYRIRRDAHHYRRGTDWKIYPLYDWAHGQSDAIEGITHSICTLEFDVNRPLYNWLLEALDIPEPRNRQYEFARLNVDYTVTSKRKLLRLVTEGHVAGWDDPRMPTIAAQQRRGVRPEAVRRFCDETGVSTVDGRVDLAFFEHIVRDDLNELAPRVMAVTNPLKVTIENLPEDSTTWIDAPFWPHDVTAPAGSERSRRVPIGREIWIERDDFAEEPPKGWKRLSSSGEVRLRHGYVIRCTGVEKNAAGDVVALTAHADLETLNADPEGRRVAGVIHWVDAAHAVPATFRLFDRLFADPAPDQLPDFLTGLNPDSLVETEGFVEPAVVERPADARYQFERLGYFWQDPEESVAGDLIFNRIVALRDSWGKKAAAPKPARTKKKETPQEPVGPRDPASALDSEQRKRYDAIVALGAGEEEAAVIAADPVMDGLFGGVLEEGADTRDAAVLLVHELRPALGEMEISASKASVASLAAVLALMDEKIINRSGARSALAILARQGGDAQDVVESAGLAAVRDESALAPAVDAAIADHPDEVARFKAGEAKLIGFFTGQAMRRAGKGADAKAVQALLRSRLQSAN